MRKNHPVTGQEYHLREDQSLISRTDTKGRITYFNRDFLEASGFEESELIGKAHNVVRHPDMPEEAFADMWRELQAGNSWTGMVKNRRKNGDHYWVLANATPISENGVVVGYTSVRTKPAREQVEAAAAAYARFTNGEARGLRIRQGKVERTGVLGAVRRAVHLNLRARVVVSLAAPTLLAVTSGIHSLYSFHAAGDIVASHYLIQGGLMLATVLTSLGMGVLLARGILRPVGHALKVIKQIAAGNLTAGIRIEREDETGEMLHGLEVMQKSLNNIIHGVKTGAEAVQQGAREIASGNLDLSRRTEQQAATLEETASSIEELTSTVQQNAENARHAKDLSDSASQIALAGGESMSRVVKTMETLNSDSAKISDFTTVIEGIAFQTNILALNAAVEAARAGEHGRGFAVVATEVRTLAQRASTASKEIKDLVAASVEGMRVGASQVAQAQKTIEEVVQVSRQAATLVAEIAHASAQQSEGIEQVHRAVAQLDQVTQQNAALVEQAAALIQAWLMETVPKMADAKRETNSRSTRLDAAYDAVLFCSLAVASACGYRVSGEPGHHKIVLEGACQAIGAGEGLHDLVEALRDWRNQKYQAGFSITDRDIGEAVDIAERVLKQVSEYFKSVKPDLLKR